MLPATHGLPACAMLPAGAHLIEFLSRSVNHAARCYFSAAIPKAEPVGQPISSNQLILLNQLGTLPSVARNWDRHASASELHSIDRASRKELDKSTQEPTAVQKALGQRYGVTLGPSRKSATEILDAVLPPSTRSLAILYGVLEYDGPAPVSARAARQLLKQTAQSRQHAHPLETDLSPAAISQMTELYDRLGYIGRAPFSYASAQLLATCLRTLLGDVEEEARLRPLPSMDERQSELIRYLRSCRAPPGTRGLPAVRDVDLTGPRGVTRLEAARCILQLLQNHKLCASPTGPPVEALRALGHSGPVPPTTGEALMLAGELKDRCMRPRPAQLAALAAAGYGTSGTIAPVPDSVAHVKALLRVLRRADTEAATPASHGALSAWGEVRWRPLASPHEAAAIAASTAAGPGAGAAACGGGGSPGPCPSQLEVASAMEELPLSDEMMDKLWELGWQGPMPSTHGAAIALESYLVHHRGIGAARGSAGGAGGGGRSSSTTNTSYHTPYGRTSFNSAFEQPFPHRHPQPPPQSPTLHGFPEGHHHHKPHHHQHPEQRFVSRLGSSPEEVLAKIQIRGMFPGAVSEWYLPSMCREEAEYLLECLKAARRGVAERAAGSGYDEYVERWAVAEGEGEWWGSEWLWL